MSDITFSCVNCGGHLAIDEAGTGLEVSCPHCDNKIRVPASSTVASMQSPAPPPVPSQPSDALQPVRIARYRASAKDLYGVTLDWIKSMDKTEVVSTDADTNEILFKHPSFGLMAKIRFSGDAQESEVLVAGLDIGLPADYKSFRMMGKDSSDFGIRQNFLMAGLTVALQKKFKCLIGPGESVESNKQQGVVTFIVGLGVLVLGLLLTAATPLLWYGALIVGPVIMLRGIYSMVTGKRSD